MKDFVFRNDTKLLFRNDVCDTIKEISRGYKVMFVYGTSSALRNGCQDDVVNTLKELKYQQVKHLIFLKLVLLNVV